MIYLVCPVVHRIRVVNLLSKSVYDFWWCPDSSLGPDKQAKQDHHITETAVVTNNFCCNNSNNNCSSCGGNGCSCSGDDDEGSSCSNLSYQKYQLSSVLQVIKSMELYIHVCDLTNKCFLLPLTSSQLNQWPKADLPVPSSQPTSAFQSIYKCHMVDLQVSSRQFISAIQSTDQCPSTNPTIRMGT